MKIALAVGGFKEAVDHEYGFIEDRLKSALFHLGLVVSRKRLTIPVNVLGGTLNETLKFKNNEPISVLNISAKIKAIKCFLETAKKMSPADLEKAPSIYLVSIKEGIATKKNILKLKMLPKWLRIRNEITHASFDKDLNDLKEKCKQAAYDGKEYCTWVDSFSKQIKRAMARAKKDIDTSLKG
ncbi:MAG: hypothetical protein J5736_01825 [Bacilli bacterium]|nr:hypothetical protein [Bacilli bacterium]